MNKEEIYQFITNNPVFFLATIENDKPRCRGMFLYKADEQAGIVFHTGANKDVFKQISKNSNVEMCFNDFKSGKQIRVSGTLEEIKDTKFKDEISSHPTRAFLKPWKESVPVEVFYSNFKVFSLKNGKAVVWTMETNFAPKQEISL